MKPSFKLTTGLLAIGFLFSIQTVEAQILDKLKKKAERTVERKLEQKTEKETGKVMDSVLDTDSKKKSDSKKQEPKKKESDKQVIEKSKNKVSLEEEGNNDVGFKRGSKILYSDDFSKDAVGDFPAKWDATVGGEVKKLKGHDNKFLKVPAKSVISLQTTKAFPTNFTVEFDVIIPEDIPIKMAAMGLGAKVPSSVDYMLTDEENFSIMFSASQYQKDALKFGTNNKELGYTYKELLYNIPYNQVFHVAFEINGRRIRVYVDNKKMIDLPTTYRPEFSKTFFVSAVTSGDAKTLENYFYISNVVIAETGTDLRSSVMKDLIEKGNFTTSNIRFASGSDKIDLSSKDILNEIGEAMQDNPEAKFMIVGHTDSDGDTQANQELSQKRAAAVKNYLVSNFSIDASHLKTSGKGESMPLNANKTAEEKAQNRRVEFIKQ
ncbi:MAG: OmpA family protein [Flavobacteriaceae bacterium]